jgi:hypothetical protein
MASIKKKLLQALIFFKGANKLNLGKDEQYYQAELGKLFSKSNFRCFGLW